MSNYILSKAEIFALALEKTDAGDHSQAEDEGRGEEAGEKMRKRGAQ